jgi:hypothetical protein
MKTMIIEKNRLLWFYLCKEKVLKFKETINGIKITVGGK